MINPNSGKQTDAKVKGDLFDGMLYYQESPENRTSEVIWDYPETLVETLNQFQKIWLIPETAIPSKKQKGKYDNWVIQLEKIRHLFSSDERMKLAMKYSIEKARERNDKRIVYQPMSIYNLLVDAIRDLRLIEKVKKQKEEPIKKEQYIPKDKLRKEIQNLLNEEE
jgi:hypothetical protein